jgi:hypothetical protein
MSSDKEISIPQLLRSLLNGKILVVKIAAIFALIGLIIAFSSPSEWKSSTVLLSEDIGGISRNGQLGALSSLAGINIPSGVGAVNPEVYAEITQSLPFLLSVLEQKFYSSSLKDSIELRKYFLNHSKSSLIGFVKNIPSRAMGLFSREDPSLQKGQHSSEIIVLDRETDKLIKALQERITLDLGKIGDITISVELQDKLMSAEIVVYVREYVKGYVSRYYQSKELRNLNFIKVQLDTSKSAFEQKSHEFARFKDSNIGLSSYSARIKEQSLQSEFNLLSGVYSTLAQRYEEAKIKVQEVTPVFTELDPVTIPPYVDSPKKKMIVLVSLLFGLIISIGWLLVKGIWLQVRD